MRTRRQAITFTTDQLALLLVEMQATGDDLAGCVRRAVSQALSHQRGGPEYKAMLPIARKMRGEVS